MKKKNIRKYIIGTIASLIVVAGGYVSYYINHVIAFATEGDTVDIQYDVDLNEIKDQLGNDLPNGAEYWIKIKKGSDDYSEEGSFTGNTATISVSKPDSDTVYTAMISKVKIGETNVTLTKHDEITITVKSDGNIEGDIKLEATGSFIANYTIDKIELSNAKLGPYDNNVSLGKIEEDLSNITITKIYSGDKELDNKKAKVGINGSWNTNGYKSGKAGCVFDATADYSTAESGITLNAGKATCEVTVNPDTPATLSWKLGVSSLSFSQSSGTYTGKGISSISYKITDSTGAVFLEGSESFAATTTSFTIDKTETKKGYKGETYTLTITGCTVDGANSATIDLEKIGNFTGDVNKTIEKNTSANVVVTVLPSKYKVLKEGGEFKNSSLGLTAKISKTLAGNILDYAYLNGGNTLKQGIDNIMDGTTELSVALVIKKQSSSSHKDSLKEKARDYDDNSKNAELKNYFDISLYVTKGGEVQEDLRITELGKHKISFNYKIPSSVTSSSSSVAGTKYYNVFTYHDGAKDVGLDYTTDTEVDFDVSQFSDFTTAVYVKSSSSSSGSSQSASIPSNTPIVPGDDAAAGGTDKSKTPKTGDDFNPRIWIYLLIVCATVASAAWILLQDTREDNEKKQN